MYQKITIQIQKKTQNRIRQAKYLLGAVLFAFALLLVMFPAIIEAYGQVANRSIQLSNTQSNATNVAYRVSFTTVTNNQNMGSIVVKFCSNSPIIGETCSVPAGMNTNAATLSLNNMSANLAGATIDTVNSTSNMVVITRGTASAFANAPVTFTLGNGTTNGITNPALGNVTFYARILTYTSTTGAGNETTDPLDAGGIAMSLANQLTVTAKVQESLFFCVFTGALCTNGGTAVALGDTNGVLASSTTVYTSTAKFEVSSNAVSGVSVKMRGDTLKSGTFTISPFGNVCTADSTNSSVEQFGLRMETLGAGQSSTAPYNCLTGNHGFDDNATTGIPSLFGQEIARTAGASDKSTSTIEFAAKSANTTEAGIYTTTLTLIATATY